MGNCLGITGGIHKDDSLFITQKNLYVSRVIDLKKVAGEEVEFGRGVNCGVAGVETLFGH
jgi:hypothetical protein